VALAAVLDQRWPVLLESGGPPMAHARWNFVACNPVARMVARDGRIAISSRSGEPGGSGARPSPPDAFGGLADLLVAGGGGAVPPPDMDDAQLPPFWGGAIGFLAYDAVDALERVPPPRDPRRRGPDAAFGLYAAVAAFDRVTERAWVIGTAPGAADGRQAARLARRRARALAARLEPGLARERFDRLAAATGIAAVVGAGGASPDPVPPAPDGREEATTGKPVWRAADRAAVEARIRRAVEHVHAGDIFQANLSQAFDVDLKPGEGAWSVHARVRAETPAPFSACMRIGGATVVSASPERFLARRGDRLETRPIKGTRPRGRDEAGDAREAAELLASEKDRAENVMIVDLMRNDLSRVCLGGSVAVDALCTLESHPTVHHLVSTVSGRLGGDVGVADILRACFPAGSITGAPKVRAMEVIAELEGERRGVYCGSIGYVGFGGDMDLNVAIRTLDVRRGQARIRAGGGIVADSDPAAEYEETLDKARALVFALTGRDLVGRANGATRGAGASRAASGVVARGVKRGVGASGAKRGVGTGGESQAIQVVESSAAVAVPAASRSRNIAGARVLLLDNYDSFVHNIARYLGELGAQREVHRSDSLSIADIETLDPTHIVISPGPGTPDEAGISVDAVRHLGRRIPILGVCLGHQAIAVAYGGRVVRAPRPVHGRRSCIVHGGEGPLAGIPSPMHVGRYHSLIVDRSSLPPVLGVTATCDDGLIMALEHRALPVYGVQFHPESLLTEHGHALLANFLGLSAPLTGAAAP